MVVGGHKLTNSFRGRQSLKKEGLVEVFRLQLAIARDLIT